MLPTGHQICGGRTFSRYGKKPEDLILLVLDMSVDIVAQPVLNLAKEIDPAGALTIAIVTNPDFSRATPTALQK
ncbi:hypothetical protein C8J56DRAFT_1043615 [Mycena floridula]|nr:hypothetical protein C8J56DRAFT_1043615 [Mycena floridula]